MPIRIIIAASLLVAAYTFSANAAQPEKIYLSKQYWEDMNWKKAESSALWRLDGWQRWKGAQGDEVTYLKTRTMILLGYEVSADLARARKPRTRKAMTLVHADISKSDCHKLLEGFAARFGAPVTSDETTAKRDQKHNAFRRLYRYDYQWQVGNTRITSWCRSEINNEEKFGDLNDKFVWTAIFAHPSIGRKLIPKFALNCTRTIIDRLFFYTVGLSNLNVWVSPYHYRIIDTDLVPISGSSNVRVSDDEIRFDQEINGVRLRYWILRTAGELYAQVVPEKGRLLEMVGECKETQMPGGKF